MMGKAARVLEGVLLRAWGTGKVTLIAVVAALTLFTASTAFAAVTVINGTRDADHLSDPSELATIVHGFAGDDVLDAGNGNDKLNGGSGNDTFEGGNDDDTLKGGPGDDTFQGGNGNDHIDAVDGEVDTVTCGNDDDVAEVDAVDQIDPFSADCETVNVH